MKCSIFLLTAFGATVAAAECPANAKCKSTLDRRSCPPGKFFREKTRALGCCPGCVTLKGEGKDCRDSEECAPGLKCGSDKICSPDKFQWCEYYKGNDPIWTEYKYWEPDCLPDGKFASKQCKGELLSGKCFCSDEMGNRLFGEQEWLRGGNMTCTCSRLVADLRKERKTVSLHCDDSGSFEELQCDDKVCWCSNRKTGLPYTPVVPEIMIAILPCYEAVTLGSQYLRQCDSTFINSHKIQKLLEDHGTNTVILSPVNCNYDGSYSRVQPKGSLKYCAYKNKQKITESGGDNRNCNCAYDKFVSDNVRPTDFQLDCDNKGDYKEEQHFGDHKFSIDPDGFPYKKTIVH